MDEILAEVLRRITPSPKERARELDFAKKVVDFLGGLDVNAILVGSLARGTDLSGDKDIDIFILFSEGTSREMLEKEGLRLGKKVFNEFNGEFEIDYAEHPYVKGRIENFEVEIVPCFMGSAIKSSVDRTPFHNRYVKRKIRSDKNLSGEIRLLKQFMKGVGVYGAEAKVQGFSGYLTEVLVIHYGSFKKVFDTVSTWSFKEIIDTENLWDDEESLKYFFTDANIIVVDPVDQDRNVAAAVSKQTLAKFIVKSKEFLKKPSIEFFFPKKVEAKSVSELKKKVSSRGTRIVAFNFSHEKINENTLYSQLRKTEIAVKKTFRESEFKIFKGGFWTNENNSSVLLFEFEVWELPPIQHLLGPPIDEDSKYQENFLQKHKSQKTYMRDGRWVADVSRKVRVIEDLIPSILEKREGFGKNLREVPVKTLFDGKILSVKDDGFRIFLDEFI